MYGVFISVAFVATFKDLKKNKTQLTTIIPPIIHQVVCSNLFDYDVLFIGCLEFHHELSRGV